MQFEKENKNRQWDYKSFGNMGTSLNPAQASQLQQLNTLISTGQGGAEIITLQRSVWETIPKQHFDEMRRLATLTGVEPSVHAPIVEPGLRQMGQGNTAYDEEHRRSEIRFINDVIDKSIELVGPHNKRNVPVNIHPDATARPTMWSKAEKDIKDDEGNVIVKRGDGYRELDWAVDRQTGQTAPLKFEVKYYPPTKPGQKEHKKIWTTDDRLQNLNLTNFEKEVAGTFGSTEFQLKQLDRVYREAGERGWDAQAQSLVRQITEERASKLHELYDDVRKTSDFEEANWHKLTDQKRTELAGAKKKYDDLKDSTQKKHQYVLTALNEVQTKLEKTKNEDELRALRGMREQLQKQEIGVWANFFGGLANDYSITPKKFATFDEFSIEKISDTFANAAVHSYDKAREKAAEFAKRGVQVQPLEIAPLVNIENMPANQFAFSRAAVLKDLVIATREKTAEILMEKKKLSKAEAEKIATKIVGATWDVGHINMLKPAGFNDEDISNEVKEIAPYVRHFHVTDNFGTTDAHLVPGQGNALPMEQVKAIKEAAREAGFPLDPKTKEIMEIGGFVNEHKISPWPFTLSYMNSPIYETDAGPTWSEKAADLGTNYFFGSSGYVTGAGNILPEAHFGMYGAGFSGLPTAFGAPIQGGDRSRFAGAPMS